MMPLIPFSTCLPMLCSLAYFLDHLWLTSILFDVNMNCRFCSISKLVNWVFSDPLVKNGLKNRKFSDAVHMLVYLNMCLVMSTSTCITFAFI